MNSSHRGFCLSKNFDHSIIHYPLFIASVPLISHPSSLIFLFTGSHRSQKKFFMRKPSFFTSITSSKKKTPLSIIRWVRFSRLFHPRISRRGRSRNFFCFTAFPRKQIIAFHFQTQHSIWIMGNLKKKRRLKMNKHKRRKRSKANRHKKRIWG